MKLSKSDDAEDQDLQDRIVAWADGLASPAPADTAARVAALKEKRETQLRRNIAICALLGAVMVGGWWRINSLSSTPHVADTAADRGPSESHETPDVSISDGDWQREAEILLDEMQRVRKRIARARAACDTEYLLQASSRQLRASRRHALLEKQAAQWLAATFPAEER